MGGIPAWLSEEGRKKKSLQGGCNLEEKETGMFLTFVKISIKLSFSSLVLDRKGAGSIMEKGKKS